MTTSIRRTLYWSPRILGILFAAFTSIFALDVFEEGGGFWQILVALGMHLIPTFALVLLLVLAWRWEWIGGVSFFAMAILYVVWAWGRFPLSVYLIMCSPLIIMSALFYVNWKYRGEFRIKQTIA